MTEDIYVKVIDMPQGLHGQVTKGHDGSFTIFINSGDSIDDQMKSYKHEMEHIHNDDFSREENIKVIEQEADGVKTLSVPAPSNSDMMLKWLKMKKKEIRRLAKEQEKLQREIKAFDDFRWMQDREKHL